jgi:hypothetical protein
MIMQSRTERIINEKGDCLELGTITLNGQEFTAQGACLWEDSQGKLRGVLYANDVIYQNDRELGTISKWETYLTSWDSTIKVFATIASTWEGNFRDYHGRRQVNRSYYFFIKGRRCRGVNYNRNWSQIVRFKEL